MTPMFSYLCIEASNDTIYNQATYWNGYFSCHKNALKLEVVQKLLSLIVKLYFIGAWDFPSLTKQSTYKARRLDFSSSWK